MAGIADSPSPEAGIALSRARATVYSFLARVYREEVDDALLDKLPAAIRAITALVDVAPASGVAALAEAAGRLESFSRRALSMDERARNALLIELATEYATLFLGHGASPVHPYESVHVGDEPLVMQRPRDQVAAIYASAGFRIRPEVTEPEDHVALELEFMSSMCSAAAVATRRGVRADAATARRFQRSFLDGHLARWVPGAGRAIQRAAREDFYLAVGQVTEAFVELDYRSLCALASSSHG